MIDPARLARALWLEVRPVAPGRYVVRGGQADHVIDVDGEYVRCDCFDAQRNGDGCKHALRVRLHRGGDHDIVRALRLLVRRPDARSTRHRTPRPDPASPESSATGPDSRQPAPQVDPGATNADDREGPTPVTLRNAIDRELTTKELEVFRQLASDLGLPSWHHLPGLNPILSSVAIARRTARVQREYGLSERAAVAYGCAPLAVRPASYARRLKRWMKKSWVDTLSEGDP